AGEVALFPFGMARDLGLCQQLALATLEEARAAYGLPRAGVQRALDRTVCWRVPIDGPINGELVEQTKRRIERALRARANVLILEIKSAGGSADKAHELGMYLASLNERNPDNP